ncbi:MAG: hypothetical protein QF760_01855 [Candidatus Thalassarchaeaceae archaeon]|nr:hypothetical protein [Candidatus Thalassarchaeaceae archaeon]MDP6703253.1 hypothetical protein [Candidatus Thalassarchaeaceae archaeon]MDP7004024.1 hypothetical protein [Candidatus Thalassarchaeaceae archaeon]
MIDLASMVLMGFQDDVVLVFGETVGWLIGHLILLGALTITVVAIRERDHILNQSGFNRSTIWHALLIVGLTLVQYQVFTSTFGFDPLASIALAVFSSFTIRWLVIVLG